jgi:hypothetical protein
MESVVHYVLLQDVLDASPLASACGAWRDGRDWSTKKSLVTCPGCRLTFAGPVAPAPASSGAAAPGASH